MGHREGWILGYLQGSEKRKNIAVQNAVAVEADRCGYLWGRAARGFLSLGAFPPFWRCGLLPCLTRTGAYKSRRRSRRGRPGKMIVRYSGAFVAEPYNNHIFLNFRMLPVEHPIIGLIYKCETRVCLNQAESSIELTARMGRITLA